METEELYSIIDNCIGTQIIDVSGTGCVMEIVKVEWIQAKPDYLIVKGHWSGDLVAIDIRSTDYQTFRVATEEELITDTLNLMLEKDSDNLIAVISTTETMPVKKLRSWGGRRVIDVWSKDSIAGEFFDDVAIDAHPTQKINWRLRNDALSQCLRGTVVYLGTKKPSLAIRVDKAKASWQRSAIWE